jgi:Sulfotransferase domain
MSGVAHLARFGRRAVRAKQQFARRHFVTLGNPSPNMIFVAGTARSGTTWLAELLIGVTRRRLIFEPFRNDRVPLWRHAARRQYLRPSNDAPAFRSSAGRILAGDFRNDWTDAYNTRLVTSGTLIKDITANLMLKWLQKQFCHFPLIYLVRHPFAVVASWEREKYLLSPADLFLTQQELVADHLCSFEDALSRSLEPFEQHLYIWCVENYVPLRQFSTGQMLVVFYEHLLLQPLIELDRIATYTGISLGSFSSRDVERSSSTTNPQTHYRSREERLSSWQDLLTPAQVAQMHCILERFGLDGIYGEDGLPRVSDPDSLLGGAQE